MTTHHTKMNIDWVNTVYKYIGNLCDIQPLQRDEALTQIILERDWAKLVAYLSENGICKGSSVALTAGIIAAAVRCSFKQHEFTDEMEFILRRELENLDLDVLVDYAKDRTS